MKKLNMNSMIKVKLTPFGADIFYHQYDELNKKNIKGWRGANTSSNASNR